MRISNRKRIEWLEKQLPRGFDWHLSDLDSGGQIPHPLAIGTEGLGQHFQSAVAAIDFAIERDHKMAVLTRAKSSGCVMRARHGE